MQQKETENGLESFRSPHFSLFPISDHLYHLRASSLNGPDQFSTYPLTVLHCRLCRALLRHTNNQTVHADQPVKCRGLQWDQIQDLPEVSSLLKSHLLSLHKFSFYNEGIETQKPIVTSVHTQNLLFRCFKIETHSDFI